ncbi:MAG: NUDIX domain-containing protein [Candidatus ainarchaeum sp.]|nr:NUDIX domain-containing protein [Candidatus ainarchaeum sp.]
MVDGVSDGKRQIVGIVVFDGEKFLLLHRLLNWVGWEFPKGAIEEKESLQETVKRELFEETGLKKYSTLTQLDSFEYFDDKRGINSFITNFLVRVSSNSKVSLNNEHVLDQKIILEHDSFKWFLPKDALKIITHSNQKKTLKKAITYLGLSVN